MDCFVETTITRFWDAEVMVHTSPDFKRLYRAYTYVSDRAPDEVRSRTPGLSPLFVDLTKEYIDEHRSDLLKSAEEDNHAH